MQLLREHGARVSRTHYRPRVHPRTYWRRSAIDRRPEPEPVWALAIEDLPPRERPSRARRLRILTALTERWAALTKQTPQSRRSVLGSLQRIVRIYQRAIRQRKREQMLIYLNPTCVAVVNDPPVTKPAPTGRTCYRGDYDKREAA